MICGVCAIGLHYLILKFLSVNLFLWGHELANSFLLFSVHKSFLQIIKKFSLRHRLHFLLTLSYGYIYIYPQNFGSTYAFYDKKDE